MKKRIFFIIIAYGLCAANSACAASASREAKAANKLYEEGNYEEALGLYEKALEKAPDNPRTLYNQAAALYKKGDYPEADSSYLKALAYGDEDIETKTLYNVGNRDRKSVV